MCARTWVCGIMVLSLLFSTVSPVLTQAATPDPSMPDPILEIMNAMPPEMKVGQLVLVSFPEMDVGAESEIATLIRDYGVGGVLLRPKNGNFGYEKLAPSDLISMTNRLQSYTGDAVEYFSQSFPGETASTAAAPYIPLLVAVESESEGVPVTAFISSTSSLPTLMALGATWDRALTEEVGNVLGRELQALGVNLLLGPDLDVLYTPRPGNASDLGTSSLGGDPFWVGELGKAYIRGLRQGSAGRLLIAPRHFPGLGSADRVLEEEIPTVQQTLAQLKQVELVPFFAAANEAPGTDHTADAFVVTHIRYRGLQGNGRTTTRPISLDAQLQSVMNLEEISPWRQGGGVLIADNLALKSIHRIMGGTFNARRVSQDALSAGNDLLILDRFAADASWDAHFANIRDTLGILAGRYNTDSTFKALVDAAVYRILSMKLRIYPSFSLAQVAVNPIETEQALAVDSSKLNTQVATQALTLVFPLSEDLLPAPPQETERVVIFAQQRGVRLGDETMPSPQMTANALAQAMLRFYGPEGTGALRSDYIKFFSFADLMGALGDPSSTRVSPGSVVSPTVVLDALSTARWVIFSTTGLGPSDPYAQALKTYLSNPIGSPDARVAVFSFGPPYELDSTEVSKLDLYYALFSPGQAFAEVAARALFGDVVASGDSPVDIPALNYYISKQTMPDSGQVISLSLVDASGQPTSTESIMMGDVIHLRTGQILDKNGHIVPDGTPVEFILSYPQENIMSSIVTESKDGVATAPAPLSRAGLLVITVQSEPAISSVRLELTAHEGESVVAETIVPTPTPTSTPTPTPTLTPTPDVTATPVAGPPRTRHLPDPIRLPAPQRLPLLAWGWGGALLVWFAGFFWTRSRRLAVVPALRIAFWGSIGSLSGYIFAMAWVRWGMPSWQYHVSGREFMAGIVSLLTGGAVLLGLAGYYKLFERKSHPQMSEVRGSAE